MRVHSNSHRQGRCPHQVNDIDTRARREQDDGTPCGTPRAHENGCCTCPNDTEAVCTDPEHATMIELNGSCDTCGTFASQQPTDTTSVATQLSDEWQSTHPPIDGDDRSPLEALQYGLISQADFWALVTPC